MYTQERAWEREYWAEHRLQGRVNRARFSYGVEIISGNRCHIRKVTLGSLWLVGLKLQAVNQRREGRWEVGRRGVEQEPPPCGRRGAVLGSSKAGGAEPKQ